MDITKSQVLNVNQTENSQKTSSANTKTQKDSEVKFSDELKNIDNHKKVDADSKKIDKNDKKNAETKTEQAKNKKDVSAQNEKKIASDSVDKEKSAEKDKKGQLDDENNLCVDEAINGLNNVLDELIELNQKDEISNGIIKGLPISDDINKEDLDLIDNNMNIQDQQDKFNLQAGMNMDFNTDGDGQQFKEFVNQNKSNELKLNVKDLAEEKAIMSTMEENIAIANKNMAMAKTKTVQNEKGIQKVDTKSNIVVDTIVKYDNVIMDRSDVEFFTNLVENGIVEMKDVAAAEKSSRVSKVLADLLAKAMNDNKPIRIDFDNNISVIIKIDRAGKISADFLPSSQVAEAYLKENLPLLKQRFDDNNIDYNELNQRQRKQDNQEDKKKGRKDE